MSLYSRRRGSQTVEFALALPLVGFMTVGIIEYGMYFTQVTDIIEAAQFSARHAAIEATALAEAAGSVGSAATSIQQVAEDTCHDILASVDRTSGVCAATVSEVDQTTGWVVTVEATDANFRLANGLIPVPENSHFSASFRIVEPPGL